MCPTAIDVLLFIMLLNNGNVKVFVGVKKITFPQNVSDRRTFQIVE